MRQSGAETLVTEEPDVLIGHVRICGGPGGQPLGLPGTGSVKAALCRADEFGRWDPWTMMNRLCDQIARGEPDVAGEK
jgi:hypothetical protein